MKTHSHLFDDDEDGDGAGGDAEPEEGMSLAAGIVVLSCISVSVVICSELLVDSIGGAIDTLGLNQVPFPLPPAPCPSPSPSPSTQS